MSPRPKPAPAPIPPWLQRASILAKLPTDGEVWVARVSGAIRAAGSLKGAAAELGLVERTLWRWVSALREDPAWSAKIPETPRGPHRWIGTQKVSGQE